MGELTHAARLSDSLVTQYRNSDLSGGGHFGLGNLQKLVEDLRLKNGQLAERFAVQLDVGAGKPVNEPGIAHATAAAGGCDSGNPQSANLPFMDATVAIGIRTRADDCLLDRSDQIAPGTIITACLFEQTLLRSSPGDAASNSHVTTSTY